MAELFDYLPVAVLRTFVQYLIDFVDDWNQTVMSYLSCRFVGPIVPDTRVKFCDPRLNHSAEIPPKAIGCGISAII